MHRILTAALVAVWSVLVVIQPALAASTWLGMVSCDVPTRIAVDGQGTLYVTESRNMNRVQVYDRGGTLLRTLSGVKDPSGVAVDGSGRIYVASLGTKSVKVYNADLTYSHALGVGDNEFLSPHSIAVAADGRVYVTDSKANKVKVYQSDGTADFSFGEWGRGAGQFNTPLGLAINGATGELYVVDWGIVDTTDGPTAGARVQVFSLDGTPVASWGSFGVGEGNLTRPLDLALDQAGRVYIADGFQGVIEVFDGRGVYAETIFDAAHPTKTPIAVAVGSDNRVFIASNNQKDLEVFGMDGYTTLSVDPKTLSFTVTEGSAAPQAQTVAVVNSGSGTLTWTASAEKWITLTPAADGSALAVSVNPAGLAVGIYTGTVTITATTGAVEAIAVTLTVAPQPAVLSVTPESLGYTAQVGGSLPEGRTIDIRNLGGGSMGWTAASGQTWLGLSAAAGTAPSQVLVTVKSALPAGTHTGQVTVTAPGAEHSPAVVNVSVTVTETGTMRIETNLQEASFTVTGPGGGQQTGQGTLWTNSEMNPGQYTVAFGHVQGGYVRPQTQTVTVTSGKAVVVEGTYGPKPVKTHVVAVTGPVMDKQVTVLTLEGKEVATFKPFDHPVTGAQTATGMLDASGADRIVVTDTVRSVKVFTSTGAELASLSLEKWNRDAVVAVGDIDNDGTAEVVVGSVVKRLNRRDNRQVTVYRYVKGGLNELSSLETDGGGSFSLAIGDVDGDRAAELVVADEKGVQALRVQGTSLSAFWTLEGSFVLVPGVAAGDVDDDGTAEVVVSQPGLVQVFGIDGDPAGTAIPVAAEKGKAASASIACGDTDGDGADEIAVATDVLTLYNGDGSSAGTVGLPGSGAAIGLGTF